MLSTTPVRYPLHPTQCTVHSRWNGNSLKWKFKVFEVAGFLAIKWKFVKMERRWAPVFAKCCKHKEWKPSKPSKFRKWAQNVKRNSKYFDNIAKIRKWIYSQIRVPKTQQEGHNHCLAVLTVFSFEVVADPKSVDSALKVFDSKRLWSNQTVAASKGILADFEAGGTGWLPNAIQSHFEPFSGLHNENIFKAVFFVSKALFPLFFSKFGLNESRLPHNSC